MNPEDCFECGVYCKPVALIDPKVWMASGKELLADRPIALCDGCVARIMTLKARLAFRGGLMCFLLGGLATLIAVTIVC